MVCTSQKDDIWSGGTDGSVLNGHCAAVKTLRFKGNGVDSRGRRNGVQVKLFFIDPIPDPEYDRPTGMENIQVSYRLTDGLIIRICSADSISTIKRQLKSEL